MDSYEKKYKDALEKARELYVEVPDSVLGLCLATIFPELKKAG